MIAFSPTGSTATATGPSTNNSTVTLIGTSTTQGNLSSTGSLGIAGYIYLTGASNTQGNLSSIGSITIGGGGLPPGTRTVTLGSNGRLRILYSV